jgi:uncharacterized membrane protein YeaQ/YmgE (transglycosylase-associated protein family)
LNKQCGGRVITIQALVIWLVIGAIAGWAAGQIMKGYGFGLIGNIVVGILGAVAAGWLLPMIGIVIGGGVLGAIINAVIGAVILLFVIGLFKR